MTAFYFGPAARQLFGYYHTARAAGGSAAVICPSWGPEYQYAHRALRTVARRLAERGTHVLRFDYSGTGDSWGDTTDGHMEQWRDDIATAIAEVKAMSGVNRVDLIGLRLGALLATQSAAARSDIRSLVLWDPVLLGRDWVQELDRKPPASPPANDSPLEFSQRLVSPRLLRQFSDIAPEAYRADLSGDLLLLRTRSGPDDSVLEPFARHERMEVEDASPWLEDTSIWSGLVPVKAVRAVVDWVAAR